ncbi:radical SAM protein [Desulfonatronum parangueonense]
MELFHTNLFQSRKWLESFLEELSKYAQKKRSIRTLGRVDDIYNCIDILPLCARLGIDAVNVGVESGCTRVLGSMKKKNDFKKLDEVVKVMQHIGIAPLINVLIGMPEDNHESLRKTYEILAKYNFATTSCQLLRPLPGTPVFDLALGEGLIDKNDFEIDIYLEKRQLFSESHPHLPTKYLGVEELKEWHKVFMTLGSEKSIHGFRS